MIRIFDIAFKDLRQLLRDYQTFLFLLAMPVVFTILFGFALGGFYQGEEDPRLPVGYIDQDRGPISAELKAILEASEVFRLVEEPEQSLADFEKQVKENDLAGAIVVPAGYSAAAETEAPLPLELIADTSTTAGTSVQSDVQRAVNRLSNTTRAAQVVSQAVEGVTVAQARAEVLEAWENPPIRIEDTTHTVEEEGAPAGTGAMTHTSPGMMLQFAIAGLLTAGQIIVDERKSRCMQRLLTTATSRVQILLGHFLAIFFLLIVQFVLLIAFGQFLLGVDYLRVPLATLLVAVSSALCIAALGLLIGVLAKSDEQAIIFSLIPMFVFAGLGGAWVPLEVTGASFQAIGHVTPVAWAMDGFENIIARGLGFNSVLLPAAALLGYAVLFFALAAWRMARAEER